MSENSAPLVTVITVVFNAAGVIQRTLDSVQQQRYKNIEHIVIDGGSTDGTVEIIRQARARLGFWSSRPDSGIYQAMNQGLAEAKGDLVGMLNAGDSYPPDAIADMVDAWRDSPQGDVYHGNVCLVARRGGYQQILLPDIDYRLLALKMTLNHPGSFVSRNAYLQYGNYDEKYKIAGDFDLFSRFYLKGASFRYLDRTMAIMSEGGISQARARDSASECHAIRISHGIPRARSLAILRRDIFLIRLRDLAVALHLYPAIRLWRRIGGRIVKNRNRNIAEPGE
jgi:glycosyltransferase involved in cell wall biosynthesis